MTIFKKVWRTIAAFEYKMLTLFVGTVVFAYLSSICSPGLVGAMNILMHIFSSGLGLYTFVLMYHAAKNTWNDGDKFLAVFYGVIVVILAVFIGYLLIFVA